MNMNIGDFVNKFSLNWQPINLTLTKKNDGSNEFYKTMTPWGLWKLPSSNDFRNDKIKTEELIRRQESFQFDHIAIHTDKTLCVIDVDFKDDKEYSQESLDWVEEMKKILPYKKSTSKKRGLHLYFYNDGNIFNTDRVEHTPYRDIEILANQWAYEALDSIVYNVGEVIPKLKLPIKDNVNMFIDKSPKVDKIPKVDKSPITTAIDNLDASTIEWIENISNNEIEKYPEWRKTLCKIKQKGEQYKPYADELSKNSTNYGNFEKTWKGINLLPRPSIQITNTIVRPAEDFYNLFGENVVVNNYEGKNEVYCYCEKTKLWKIDNKLCLIKYNIGKLLNEKYATDLVNESNDEVRKTKLGILSKSINVNNWRTDVANTFICEVLGNQDDNINFDAIDYLYHFKNTTLDLRDLTFRDRTKEDYCSIFGCQLNDRNNEKIKLWDDIITSVFPDPEMKKTYLDIIINSFSGVVLQKFIVFNGSGSNGKGMLDNCFKYLHNQYYYKGACSDLCQPNKGGSNPSLANCDKKRFCVYTEPNERDSLQVSTIKDMTGEDTINARKNYSNNTETKMGGVKIIECNKRLKLSGDTGYSIQRRLIDLLFESTFKTKDGVSSFDTPYHKEDNPTGFHEANTEYETNEWREEHCSDLFHYLYDYMRKEGKTYKNISSFVVCKKVKDRTKEYIHDNNDFLAFIHNYCEPSKDDSIQVKDLVNVIKLDYDRWNLLSKKEKQDVSVPKLSKKLQEDPQLTNFFKKRRKVEGKDMYNVLLHYKLIESQEEDDE